MIYTEKKDVMSGYPYKFRCRAYGKYDKEFSGVSPTGIDKEYSDLDDYDGLGYTQSVKRSINATRIGNLTLSDYNISGFSTINYLSESISELGSVWEIRAKFKTSSSTITGGQKILSIGTQNSERKYALIFLNNSGEAMYIRTSSNGVDAILTGSTQPTISNNTTYYIKIGSNGTKSYSYYSTTGFSDMTLIEEVNTPTTIPADTLYLGYEPYYTAKGAFGGTIDLKECSIKKASQYFPDTWTTVWQGTTYQCTELNFSNTTLPWKWGYQRSLKTKKYAFLAKDQNVTYYGNEFNGTIIGSPAISSDRVISEFSTGNYLRLPSAFMPASNPWEIVWKFRLNTLNTQQYFYGSSTDYFRTVGGEITSSNKFGTGISSNGTSWDIGWINSSTTLSANTWYWVKISFTGTMYKMELSTDGENWNLENSRESSTPIYQNSSLSMMYLGTMGNKGNYVRGEIDLNECYIKIGDNIWWRGFDKITLQGCINGSSDTGGNYYCYAINGDDHIELVKKTGSVIDARPTSPRYLGEVDVNSVHIYYTDITPSPV